LNIAAFMAFWAWLLDFAIWHKVQYKIDTPVVARDAR
jgi:hypothetical protein